MFNAFISKTMSGQLGVADRQSLDFDGDVETALEYYRRSVQRVQNVLFGRLIGAEASRKCTVGHDFNVRDSVSYLENQRSSPNSSVCCEPLEAPSKPL